HSMPCYKRIVATRPRRSSRPRRIGVTPASTTAPRPIRRYSGLNRPKPLTGSNRGAASWSGMRHTQSGSSTRRSMPPTTATIATTADGGWRRGNKIPLKDTMDKALESCPTVKNVLVVNRTDAAQQVPMTSGRDVWWHEALNESGAEIVEPEKLDAEHPLYIL